MDCAPGRLITHLGKHETGQSMTGLQLTVYCCKMESAGDSEGTANYFPGLRRRGKSIANCTNHQQNGAFFVVASKQLRFFDGQHLGLLTVKLNAK
jgi:hypothetical protein